MIRVVLRCENRLIADTLTAYLHAHSECAVVATATGFDDLRRMCALRAPDAVVVHLPDGLGLDRDAALGQLGDCARTTRLVLLHERLSLAELCDLWQVGVETLVSCSRGADALVAALRPQPDGHAGASVGLTELEQQVIAQLSAGHTVARIAELLEVSVSRVANAKRALYRKLGVSSQSHAVARAIALGIGAHRNPRPRVAHRVLDRAPAARVRGADGPVRELVTGALLAGGVPVQDDAPLLVLVDPQPRDWPAGAGEQEPIVLVLSRPPTRAELLEALLRGVSAVITADEVAGDLAAALTLTAHGFVALDADAAGVLLDAVRQPAVPVQRPELTSRESDILLAIADGHTVRRTARALGIAEKTVENTQARLFRKLGARNRTGALSAAHALGLIPTCQAPS